MYHSYHIDSLIIHGILKSLYIEGYQPVFRPVLHPHNAYILDDIKDGVNEPTKR